MLFRKWYRFSHAPSASSNNSSVLFDIKNPSTMTRLVDVSTKWKDSTVAMANSSKYGVVMVYDNSYGAKEILAESEKSIKTMVPKVAGSWDVHTHCEWCGQRLDYVAVIVGIENRTGDAHVSHIGCDCVGKIFGTAWSGYRIADSAKKILVVTASRRRRAIEYPVKFAKELAWLDSLPEFLLKRNTFLTDMKSNLRTGDRPMSKKMVTYLHILMHKKEYDPKNFAIAKQEIDKTREKLRGILHLVEEIDSEDVRYQPWSAYSFVKSIMDKFEQYHNPLTRKQMDALNRVYVRYSGKRIKRTENQMKGNPNEIPW